MAQRERTSQAHALLAQAQTLSQTLPPSPASLPRVCALHDVDLQQGKQIGYDSAGCCSTSLRPSLCQTVTSTAPLYLCSYFEKAEEKAVPRLACLFFIAPIVLAACTASVVGQREAAAGEAFTSLPVSTSLLTRAEEAHLRASSGPCEPVLAAHDARLPAGLRA